MANRFTTIKPVDFSDIEIFEPPFEFMAGALANRQKQINDAELELDKLKDAMPIGGHATKQMANEFRQEWDARIDNMIDRVGTTGDASQVTRQARQMARQIASDPRYAFMREDEALAKGVTAGMTQQGFGDSVQNFWTAQDGFAQLTDPTVALGRHYANVSSGNTAKDYSDMIVNAVEQQIINEDPSYEKKTLPDGTVYFESSQGAETKYFTEDLVREMGGKNDNALRDILFQSSSSLQGGLYDKALYEKEHGFGSYNPEVFFERAIDATRGKFKVETDGRSSFSKDRPVSTKKAADQLFSGSASTEINVVTPLFGKEGDIIQNVDMKIDDLIESVYDAEEEIAMQEETFNKEFRDVHADRLGLNPDSTRIVVNTDPDNPESVDLALMSVSYDENGEEVLSPLDRSQLSANQQHRLAKFQDEELAAMKFRADEQFHNWNVMHQLILDSAGDNPYTLYDIPSDVKEKAKEAAQARYDEIIVTGTSARGMSDEEYEGIERWKIDEYNKAYREYLLQAEKGRYADLVPYADMMLDKLKGTNAAELPAFYWMPTESGQKTMGESLGAVLNQELKTAGIGDMVLTDTGRHMTEPQHERFKDVMAQIASEDLEFSKLYFHPQHGWMMDAVIHGYKKGDDQKGSIDIIDDKDRGQQSTQNRVSMKLGHNTAKTVLESMGLNSEAINYKRVERVRDLVKTKGRFDHKSAYLNSRIRKKHPSDPNTVIVEFGDEQVEMTNIHGAVMLQDMVQDLTQYSVEQYEDPNTGEVYAPIKREEAIENLTTLLESYDLQKAGSAHNLAIDIYTNTIKPNAKSKKSPKKIEELVAEFQNEGSTLTADDIAPLGSLFKTQGNIKYPYIHKSIVPQVELLADSVDLILTGGGRTKAYSQELKDAGNTMVSDTSMHHGLKALDFSTKSSGYEDVVMHFGDDGYPLPGEEHQAFAEEFGILKIDTHGGHHLHIEFR